MLQHSLLLEELPLGHQASPEAVFHPPLSACREHSTCFLTRGQPVLHRGISPCPSVPPHLPSRGGTLTHSYQAGAAPLPLSSRRYSS